jgi:hypothetical protein
MPTVTVRHAVGLPLEQQLTAIFLAQIGTERTVEPPQPGKPPLPNGSVPVAANAKQTGLLT